MLRVDDVDGVCSVNDGVISMMLVMMALNASDVNHDGVVDDDGGDVVDDLHLQDLVCTEP